MQEKPSRRTNADRSQSTRAALVGAARELFVRSGYAETGTPEIVAAAEITRGALYHHFTDKAALFEAVLRDEAKAVFDAIAEATKDSADPMTGLEVGADAYLDAIAEATKDIADPMTGLEVGADAYLDAMAVPGRTRLLLVEGPAVLGAEAMAAIDREFPAGSLTEGLSCLVGRAPDAELEAFSSLLTAAFDRAALDIVAGAAPGPYRRLLKQLLGNVPQVLTPDGI